MRFIVKQSGCGSERLGTLTGFWKSPGMVIETPTAALFTQGGSVVHLTSDVLSRVFSTPQLLWMPLSNSAQLENGVKMQNEGVAKFAGLPGHVTCVTFNNLAEVAPTGHFEPNKVPLWTKNGKKMLTANRYMEIMEVFKPDIILAVADGRTSLNEGFKRVAKAVDRTADMLKECVEKYKNSKELQGSTLVGVVVAAANPKKCEESIQNILKYADSLGGFALQGITDGTAESLDVNVENLNEVFKRVNDALPKDVFRIIEGCWNPEVILSAIEHGWDVFDGSYPLKLTNAGIAMKFSFDVTKENDSLCLLDMVEEKYKEDFSPILGGCSCLSCAQHSRAYLRHLLATREMLASVLLNIHNLHHFDQMFLHARQHIASGTFSTYRQHIAKQYELLKTIDRYKGLNAPIEKPTIQRKKKRVSEDNVDNSTEIK